MIFNTVICTIFFSRGLDVKKQRLNDWDMGSF